MKVFALVLVASLILVQGAFAEINFSADVETNTDFAVQKT
jgi:hypothetical protein